MKPLFDSTWESQEDEDDWEDACWEIGEHRLYQIDSKADFRDTYEWADFTDFKFTEPGVYKMWISDGKCGRCWPPCHERTIHARFHATEYEPFVLFEEDV